jgi:hypothetical protein
VSAVCDNRGHNAPIWCKIKCAIQILVYILNAKFNPNPLTSFGEMVTTSLHAFTSPFGQNAQQALELQHNRLFS